MDLSALYASGGLAPVDSATTDDPTVYANLDWMNAGTPTATTDTNNTYSGSGTTTAPAYDPGDIAYLDDQKGALERQLGRTDSTLANTLDALLQNYNKSYNEGNLTYTRNKEDLATKEAVSERGRSRELGKNDTSARMLADSLRQRLGLASGSGSSAYQITAPRAVQRQASEGRTNILEDYSANFKNIADTRRRSDEDWNYLTDELQKQRTEREGNARADIEGQKNEILGNIGQLEGKRADILGGGYTEIKNAMNPWNQRVASGESLIDGIYNKYAAKYNVNPIQQRSVNLNDYSTDKVAVRDQAATGADEYSPYKNYAQEDEENVGAY
jgi:hypothetical protein